MRRSRWRLPVAGATVVVGAATGIVTNLITSKWSVSLAVGLGVLLVLGVALQVALAAGDGGDGKNGDDGDGARVRLTARARGQSTVIQAGRDVYHAGRDMTIGADRSAGPPDEEKPAR